jgi:hypothetical protein
MAAVHSVITTAAQFNVLSTVLFMLVAPRFSYLTNSKSGSCQLLVSGYSTRVTKGGVHVPFRASSLGQYSRSCRMNGALATDARSYEGDSIEQRFAPR